jgi:hypothetical protein
MKKNADKQTAKLEETRGNMQINMGENQQEETPMELLIRGGKVNVAGKLTNKEALIFVLDGLAEGTRNKKARKEVEEIRDYLATHLKALHRAERISGREAGSYRISYTLTGHAGETEEEVKRKVGAMMNNRTVIRALAKMDDSEDEYLDYIKKLRDLEKREAKLKKQEEEIRRRSRVPMSKHLVGNILPKRSDNPAASLWDQLGTEETKAKIEQHNAMELVNAKGEGVRLDQHEERMIWVLNEMMNKKEQSQAISNVPMLMPAVKSGGVEMDVPQFATTMYEVAKEFTGRPNPSGSDIMRARDMIIRLAQDPDKKCLMRWTRRVYDNPSKRGTYNEMKVENYASLIDLYDVTGTRVKDGRTVEEQQALVIRLHPIFRDQIDRFYVKLPTMAELYDAQGSTNMPRVTIRLLLELARVESDPRAATETTETLAGKRAYLITQDRLFEKIAPDYMPPNKKRPKVIEEQLARAVETAVKIGLIEEADSVPGKRGVKMYRFFLKERPKKGRPATGKTPNKRGRKAQEPG